MPSHENEYEVNSHSSTARSHPDFPWHPLQSRIQDAIALGRLIIVGDIHGHLPELKKLLEKVSYNRSNGDILIVVGDLINKGPDSPGVVQLAIELGACAIRGNNEDRVLAAHSAITRGEDKKLVERLKRLAIEAERKNEVKEGETAVAEAKEDLKSISPEELKPYSSESDLTTAADLTDEQISWLASQPLILRIKLQKGATSPPWNSGTLLVAHGSLVPLLPLEEQDPWAVMNMRGLVYQDPEAIVTEPIRAGLLKGAKSRTRRYAAYHDATDADIKTELGKWADVVNNGEGFSGEYKEGVIGFPLETREGDWWIDAWNRWQNSIEDPEKRSIVVYGHDARVGIQVGEDSPEVARYTFGLDSGCVYGKSLTAMVIDEKDDIKGLSHSIVQVDAIKKDEEKEGEAV
ncbi:bis(5' nucleosyl)-tetraphosphatase symmetrical [Fusarium coicis]|nr:bis(5' nucleosyl)-tetraphosphatase symmetrical [Fusarium coicis]